MMRPMNPAEIEAQARKELAHEDTLKAIAEAKLRLRTKAHLQFPFKITWKGWYRYGPL